MKVRFSDIETYLFCPRKLYFDMSLGKHVEIESMVAREIYHQWRNGLKGEDLFDAVENHVSMIYDTELDTIRMKLVTLRKILPLMEQCERLNMTLSLEHDLLITSTKIGVAGILDELVKDGDVLRCLFLRKRPPKHGVWTADKIKLALAVLILRDSGSDVDDTGLVYYWNTGEIREHQVTIHDRRLGIRISERVRRILDDFLPDKTPNKEKCKLCIHRIACEVKGVSLRSKFF